jgi:lipopolysaccharide/colanic/teichoic acid biosynthesis glycosyltransferase
MQRFRVKPGLTGLWQVSGRNERTYEEMVRLDIEYAHSRTLQGDIAILAKTPWVVLSRRGAG